jgi:DNA-binding SARP family transcriptional activator
VLRICLFGSVRVSVDDTPLPVPNPPKLILLWAYLLLRRTQPVPRDQVAFALWADESEANARANLRRHLYLLRQYLPSAVPDRPWFLSEHDTLQWNPRADYWLDVAAFEEAANVAHAPAQQSSAQEMITRLQAALALYGGNLLEGSYEDWVLPARERLDREFTLLLEELAARQEAIGDARGALAAAKRLLEQDLLREHAHRLVMRLLYLTGDRAAALNQFQECSRLLRQELDVEPMPETLRLRDAIANGEALGLVQPDAAAPAVSALTAPSALPGPDTASSSSHEPSIVLTPASRFKRRIVPRLARRAALAFAFIGAVLLLAGALFSRAPAIPLKAITFGDPSLIQDTWITSEIPETAFDPEFPNDRFAEFTQIHLQFYGGDLDRVLLRFELRALPRDIPVERAQLRVFLETWTTDTGRNKLQRPYPATVAAYRLRKPWQPETATWRAPWAQPGLGAGVDYDPQPLARQVIKDSGWLELDVTTAARDWAAQPESNYGLMLKIDEAPEGTAHYWVYTVEQASENRRPQLIIYARIISTSSE